MNKLWMAIAVTGLISLPALAEPDIELSDAWVRALPPGQPHTAAYLTIANHGSTAVGVIGGSSEAAARVEIHTTRKIDGFMRMEQLQGVAVAPGESVEFAPGGTHLMLLELKYMPVPGDEIDLCLELASGAQVCTVAQVHKSGPTSGAPDHQHHH